MGTVATRDLVDRADIDVLLRRFYGRALGDEILADPFTEIREMGLESHLPVMCDFWETILFAAGTYRGSLFRVHMRVAERHPFAREHFDRWLVLWRETVDGLYVGPVAERAKLQGERIAVAMHRRMAGLPGLAAEVLKATPGGTVPLRGGHDGPRHDNGDVPGDRSGFSPRRIP